MAVSIPLRTYRWTRRKARLDLDGTRLTLVLPSYFGDSRWQVPLADIAVVDLERQVDDDDAPSLLFAKELLLPYLFTTGPATDPTLGLFFRTPQRVPPLRWIVSQAPNVDLPFGYRSSRSADGACIDGVLLRAADAASAVDVLRRAGVAVSADPEGWLAENREVVTDPAARDGLLRRISSLERLDNVSSTGFLGGVAALIAAEHTPHGVQPLIYTVGGIGFATALAAHIVGRRIGR